MTPGAAARRPTRAAKVGAGPGARAVLEETLGLTLLASLACAAPPPPPPSPAPSAMTLGAPAFEPGAAIPRAYTCEGDDAWPALVWSGAPATAKTFALIVDDPDAPDPAAPKVVWVHRVLYDVPADALGLPDAAPPAGAHDGTNDWGKTGWGGPCPPIGVHRYFFKLYALDISLGDRGALTKTQLEAAMAGHVVGQATLIGTYQKGA